MKFIVSVLLIAFLSYVLSLFLPWWVIAIAAFVVSAFIPQKSFISFLSGFIALFLLWGIMSWMISTDNHDLLAHRVSMLIIKQDNPVLLILMTALIGAVVAGFAALAGSFIHRPVKRKTLI